MQLLDMSSLSKATQFTRSPTQESKATAESFGINSTDDESTELCQRQHTERQHLEIQETQHQWKRIILRHRCGITVAACVLLFLVLGLSSLLVLQNRYNKTGSNHRMPENDDLPWFNEPSFEGYEPERAPIGQPVASLREQLKMVLGDADMALLDDSESVLGRAYRWIADDDDMQNVVNNRSTIQRFVMAAFYFATGGGRATATWNSCSAVPVNQMNDDDNFETVCVMEEWDDMKREVCATEHAFVECREYYDDQDIPLVPKARWLSKVSECSWYGVSCNDDGAVVEITLPGNGLDGTILPQLYLLTELKTLNLTENTLVGSVTVPGAFHNLEVLDFSFNQLDVDIRLGSSLPTGLTTLKLAANTIASTFPEDIVKLDSLRILDLSDTRLEGPLPDTIGQLSSLVELNLENNDLSEAIPESLWTLTNLEVLRLGKNAISGGTLSANVGNLVNLKELSLVGLNFGDSVPVELGNIKGLETLELQDNLFVGDIPPEVCMIPGLVDFWADCDGITCKCCTHCCTKGKCN